MLKQKNAIITGSTSGIGLAIAKEFARQGCNLVIGGYPFEGSSDRLCSELATEAGVKVIFCGLDLSKPENARRLVADAIDSLGRVDVVVNNAGAQFVSPITEFPDEKWEFLRSLMLDTPFRIIKAVLPGMIERGWGRIINISSAHGIVASPHKPAYIAAKHGLVGLTRAVALEVADKGVTCNAICPGLVMTDIIRKQLASQAKVLDCTEEEALQRVFLANTPTNRAIDPSEIAATAAFLCSDGARSITGATIVVDGGYTAR
jgi:3-hydroxybutyrate dehydrogenase